MSSLPNLWLISCGITISVFMAFQDTFTPIDNFESTLIAELLSLAAVDKSHTTPYHPMGNGCCERMNRTLGNMIQALPPKAKHRWPQALKSLTFAYNCTIHETTGYAPFLLMFGRIPRLQHILPFTEYGASCVQSVIPPSCQCSRRHPEVRRGDCCC